MGFSYNSVMRSARNIALFLAIVLLTTGCTTLSTNDVSEMLVKFSSNFPQIKRLVFAFSYLLGFWLIMSAIHKFKMLSSPSQMQSTASGAVIQLLIGAMLIAMPSFIKMTLYSLWGTESIMRPSSFSGGVLSASVEKAVVGLIQLLGYISVVRGFMILNKVARQQASQDTFGKGIVHIIGGILAINIMKTIDVIKNSFGL
jgi:intracellular multiplication protein IcmC